MTGISDDAQAWATRLRGRVAGLDGAPMGEHVGQVLSVGDGVATVSGLPETRLDELLVFAGGVRGIAFDLAEEEIGCVLLGEGRHIAAGSEVAGTGAVARVPVGEALLGRIVSPLGEPLDDGPRIAADGFEPVEKPAPGIIDRSAVTRPLLTGLVAIDSMIPIGRGQRELIIGDRGTGKTSIAVDTIINQRDSDVICIYAAIGQKTSDVNAAIDAVRRHGRIDRTIFVAAAADAPAGLQWLAPYAACTMGEWFAERGRDVLLVFDELTKHAVVYRELSLLLRRPPGREAYPGDIFYIHARLLERCACLSEAKGGGSLTALPIVETQAGDISAYIPTNLISITDGQIYLDAERFQRGVRPAIDVGRSVSRVGGRSQPPAIERLAGNLRIRYAQFLELEVFTRFGMSVDEATRGRIEGGRRIRAALTQARAAPLRLGVEVALLLAVAEGLLEPIAVDRVPAFTARLPEWLALRCVATLEAIERSGDLGEADEAVLGAEIAALAAEVAAP